MKSTWQTKKLGEICDFFNGLWKGKEPPFINVGVIRNTNFTKDCKLDDSDIAYLEVEVKQYNKRKLEYGDVIVEKSGGGPKQPVGRTIIFDKKDGEFSFSNFTSAIRVKNNKEINSNYLQKFLFFQYQAGITEAMQSHSTGIRNLNLNLYKNIDVPLPLISEQQRIVKILDEAFEKIEKVKQNAEKNLQNSKEIFESYLQNIFTNKNNDWKKNRFGEIIDLLTDYHANGSYQVLKANVDLKDTEDYAWMVRSTDFENNFQKDKRYITKKSYDFLKKSKIFGNEIIICKIGNAGKVYLMPKINRPCSLAMNSFLIRLNEAKCLSEYVYQYLNSKNGREQIESRILGTATKTITKDNVRSIIIPYPSLNEQNIIVEKINALSEGTKKLESIYKQKLTDLEELKKSILSKAFSGEL
jgi:type I restriction enzyme S subunit